MNKFVTLLLVLFSLASAKIIYVDATLDDKCHTYSPAARDCSGDQWAFKTVQMAVDSMTVGDTIQMRSGTYAEKQILILDSKNGTSWESGHFNTLMSYPNEWAVVDGKDSAAATHGLVHTGTIAGQAGMKYWQFLDFEVKRGANGDGRYNAYGMSLGTGPFKLRRLYIHDNIAATGDDNPSGVAFYTAVQCTVEYCYFKNNGAIGMDHWNGSHLEMYGDTKQDSIGVKGFNAYDGSSHSIKNVIRFNYFGDSAYVAIKQKNPQFLTGRNYDPGRYNPYTDTAAQSFSSDISYNIFKSSYSPGYLNHDFIQFHHNIVDCKRSINITEGVILYKPFIYNNTFKKGVEIYMGSIYSPPQTIYNHYYLIYNNIMDSTSATYGGVSYTLFSGGDNISDVAIKRNWSARALGSTIAYNGTSYDIPGYKAIYPDLVHFLTNTQETFFIGSTGKDQYIAQGAYAVSGDTTVANGGIGGNHPYITGITLPTYLGATDPNATNNWITVVMSLPGLATGSWSLPDTGTGTYLDSTGMSKIRNPIQVSDTSISITVIKKTGTTYPVQAIFYSKYGVELSRQTVTDSVSYSGKTRKIIVTSKIE